MQVCGWKTAALGPDSYSGGLELTPTENALHTAGSALQLLCNGRPSCPQPLPSRAKRVVWGLVEDAAWPPQQRQVAVESCLLGNLWTGAFRAYPWPEAGTWQGLLSPLWV